jgi:dienelactone hydrolase
MGFAVVQIDPSTHASVDPIATRLKEVELAIAQLAKTHPINSSRIALYGSQEGAVVALNFIKRTPESFRCAVTIEPFLKVAPTETPKTAEGRKSKDHEYFDPKERPQILGATPRALGGIEVHPLVFISGRIPMIEKELPDADSDKSIIPKLTPDKNLGLYRAAAFRTIEDYLNLKMYDYRVEAGATKVIDD